MWPLYSKGGRGQECSRFGTILIFGPLFLLLFNYVFMIILFIGWTVWYLYVQEQKKDIQGSGSPSCWVSGELIWMYTSTLFYITVHINLRVAKF